MTVLAVATDPGALAAIAVLLTAGIGQAVIARWHRGWRTKP